MILLLLFTLYKLANLEVNLPCNGSNVYHNFTVTQIYEPVWSCMAKQVLIFLGI